MLFLYQQNLHVCFGPTLTGRKKNTLVSNMTKVEKLMELLFWHFAACNGQVGI